MDRESQAFADLFDAHYRAVCRYIAARGGSQAVDDVAAETFLVAWRRRSEMPAAARGWLLRTAGHCLANHERTRERTARLRDRLAADATPLSPSVEEALHRIDQGRALATALAALRPDERELLLLRYWDGLAGAELAAAAGCSVIAVRARLHRARRRLHDAFAHASASAQTRPLHLSPTPEGTNR